MMARSKAREEKIYVTVRVRPLNSKESAQGETADWSCSNDHTVVYRPATPERSALPSCYVFDRVFGPECATQRVYEQGAKDVSLSALNGLNSTIFAYGQTSSGKTYTMRGIMDCAVCDIYDYVQKKEDREFVLKVSAMEIYNEAVRDLLHPEAASGGGQGLKLLDDPEKGTVVEKIVEEVIQDIGHLRRVLAVCEAQRQVGQTSLNDTSSRSHQIIRLSVESFPRVAASEDAPGAALVASLNFVDLAGSERASQTMAEGTRLKEGTYINRSLLTLGTVIRKLSSGNSGHIPYRDSKLTRILQNSLGGNARTAIICTMSPAHSHVEQTRNTLSFATRAKEVTNKAEVNVIMSDKLLVKQLQKEVARLEAERKTPEPPGVSLSTEGLILAKDLEIQRMMLEMKELQRQRDAAQEELAEVKKRLEEEQETKKVVAIEVPVTQPDKQEVVQGNGKVEEESPLPSLRPQGVSLVQSASALVLVDEIYKLEHLQDQLGEDAGRALEALQKEIECLRLAQAGMNEEAGAAIKKLQSEIHDMHSVRVNPSMSEQGSSTLALAPKSIRNSVQMQQQLSRLQALGEEKSNAEATIATLEAQLENVQMSLDTMLMVESVPESPVASEENSPALSCETPVRKKKSLPLAVSSNIRQRLLAGSPPGSPRSHGTRRSHAQENNENVPPPSPRTPKAKSQSKDAEPSKDIQRKKNSVDVRKMQTLFKTAAEENIKSIRAYVSELKERVSKLQYQKQLLMCQVLELEANKTGGEEASADEETEAELENVQPSLAPVIPWHAQYESQRNLIIELWHICQVSIIHRTQFYLLFRGDPADAIYLEVELRRLKWLHENGADPCIINSPNPSFSPSPIKSLFQEEQGTPLSASARALRRERELLSRRMRTRLTLEEREELYSIWQVPVDSKQRRLQLAQRLWTSCDLAHVQASAEIVARIVGFWEPGNLPSKEMFELNLAPPNQQRPWIVNGLNSISTLLHL